MPMPNQRALPATITPTGTRCVKVDIPDDDEWERQFFSEASRLAIWNLWKFDTDHNGTVVAKQWRTAFQTWRRCDMIAIRLKPTDFCVLQLSDDGGITWTDVADLSACATAMAAAEIARQIAAGDLSGGGESEGQGAGNPGQCYDYTISLKGSGQWLSPVAVAGDDIITVSDVKGAWSDGYIGGLIWFCGDGSGFTLGACVAGGTTVPADPLNTTNHMTLLGYIAGAAVPFFPLYNTTYNVPTAEPLAPFALQANDNNLPDNLGDLTMHVQICKAGWRHDFDFTLGTEGWTAVSPTTHDAQGFEGGFVDSASQNNAEIFRTISATTIIRWQITYDLDAQSGSNGYSRFATTPSGLYGSHHSATGVDLIMDESVTRAACTVLDVSVNSGSSAATVCRIKHMTVWGLGTDPF